ncbi:MAG: hypothetical protein WCP21_16540, partial [Armatimonadota bacterium]
MLAKLARIILAFACFPLLGAFSLRWVGRYISDLAGMARVESGVLPLLDLAGAILGVILGLLLAVQIIGCCLQPEVSPVRPVGDNILIILAFALLTDVLLPKVAAGSVVVTWLPPVSLAVWAGCGAATLRLGRLREDFRQR